DEFAVMKLHCEQGAALLEASVALRSVAPLVRAHHERPDGRGYPDGLSGEAVTIDMAIVSACDAWDAMTNDRQYREGMAPERAREILRSGAGAQWRADVIAHLLDEIGSAPSSGTFADVGKRSSGAAAGPVCADTLPALVPSAP
ncbi:MAG: HD-GYP domain-containing protein, partial [Acidimicrobiales bacterium]